MFNLNIDTLAAICFASSITFPEDPINGDEKGVIIQIACPDFDIIDKEQAKFDGDFICYFSSHKFNPFKTECQNIYGIYYSCYFKDCIDEYNENVIKKIIRTGVGQGTLTPT
uniref:Uncharacterized protein n=1 Tax=Strongyloides stercoralis TaxID=6248 RepID=A0A0K0E0H7_STRER